MNEAGGILLLDKPAGLSSNGALQRVRRLYARIKAGHTGSLDPLATGMLPICLGEATKVAGELLSERKAYVFTLRLGTRTSTGDAEGEVVETAVVPPLQHAEVAAHAATMRGARMQVPPMYSALKRQGEPLYKLARRGVEVAREARPIEIHTIEVLRVAPPGAPHDVEVRVACSKGTYVRVLGEELATLLGTCGHLASLRREFVAPFEQEPMWTLEQLEVAGGPPPEALLPADRALPHLPAVHLDGSASVRLRHGQPVRPDPGIDPGRVRVYDDKRRLAGLGEVDGAGLLKPTRLFVLPS